MSDYGYTIREAAEILGIAWETLRYHRYVSKHFAGLGVMKGTTLIFSAGDVEEMRRRLPAISAQRGMGNAQHPERLTALTTEERIQRAEALLAEGKTQTEIAQDLGYTNNTAVSRLLSRAHSRPSRSSKRK